MHRTLTDTLNLNYNKICVSFRSQPPLLAVGSDDANPANGGKIFIYEYDGEARRWNRVDTLKTVTEPVHDLAFAPNVGRSYNVLGIGAAKDLKIVTLKPLTVNEAVVSEQFGAGSNSTGGDSSNLNNIIAPHNVTKYEVRVV